VRQVPLFVKTGSIRVCIAKTFRFSPVHLSPSFLCHQNLCAVSFLYFAPPQSSSILDQKPPWINPFPFLPPSQPLYLSPSTGGNNLPGNAFFQKFFNMKMKGPSFNELETRQDLFLPFPPILISAPIFKVLCQLFFFFYV